jgi:hypothetical protein
MFYYLHFKTKGNDLVCKIKQKIGQSKELRAFFPLSCRFLLQQYGRSNNS